MQELRQIIQTPRTPVNNNVKDTDRKVKDTEADREGKERSKEGGSKSIAGADPDSTGKGVPDADTGRGEQGSNEAENGLDTVELVTLVLTLPTLTPIEQMIQAGQSHCSIDGVVVQNGVTTNQVKA